MPLTLEELHDIRADCFADDIDIDHKRMAPWTSQQARDFFFFPMLASFFEFLGRLANIEYGAAPLSKKSESGEGGEEGERRKGRGDDEERRGEDQGSAAGA